MDNISEADAAGCDEIRGMLTGKPCPMTTASLFSYFTWQWMQPFITAGNKKPLEVQHFTSPFKLVTN
jgi:hypothetical protein